MARLYEANLQTVTGDPFTHKVYVNKAAFTDQTDNRKQRFLHVYIDNDGIPYKYGYSTNNPTPLTPLLLDLMSKDKQPAIYLGRPCYFVEKDNYCHKIWWTSHRYNQQVVTSLLAALSHFSHRYEFIVLIGHSGGGALAMLMAEQMQEARILVTLAANLDVFEWTTHHEYDPLEGSLDPADLSPLRKNIIQLHYAGKDDEIIKANWIKEIADKQHQAEFHLIKDADHNCCWADLWPGVLTKIESYQSFVD